MQEITLILIKIDFTHNFSKGTIFRIIVMENNNNNNSGLGIVVSIIDDAGIDIVNESLILAQMINPLMPSIILMYNSILNTSTETATNEFHPCTIDFYNFMDSDEKYDACDYSNTNTLHHAKENDDTTHHAKKN